MTGRHEVERLRKRLVATFARIDRLGTDLEIRADFARHLCVLVSGFFENAVVELLLAYCSRCCHPGIVRYVESRLEWFTNANREKLLQLLGSFDPAWRTELEAFVIDERDAALNSVVALRNDIAHGGSGNVSYVQIKLYYERIEEIIDKLADMLDPVT